MIRRLAVLCLALTFLGGAPVQADTRPRSTRLTFRRPRVDPRRRPVVRQRITEFQPVTSFVPPLGAPLTRRNTFYRIGGRAAEIDRRGAENAIGGFGTDPLRFYNNRILVERRTSFFRRR